MAVTWTVGGVMSGYWATGSRKAATPPTSTMTSEMTQAKIGRSTKKRANTDWLRQGSVVVVLGRGQPGLERPDRRSGPETGKASVDDEVVLGQLLVASLRRPPCRDDDAVVGRQAVLQQQQSAE